MFMLFQNTIHDDVIKWRHFPRYWPFVRGMHPWHKSQWRGALMLSLIYAWTNGGASNREAGDLRRHRAHYDVTVMFVYKLQSPPKCSCFCQTIIVSTLYTSIYCMHWCTVSSDMHCYDPSDLAGICFMFSCIIWFVYCITIAEMANKVGGLTRPGDHPTLELCSMEGKCL